MPDRDAAARAIDAFLRALGRDPATEPELLGTGERVASAFIDELCDGYAKDPQALVRENAMAGTTSLVVLRDVSVSTTCPHHLMPAIGEATVAFAPRETILGLGAMAAALDAFAHRFTLQEQIGENVVALLHAELAPRWAACRIALRHGCLSARGERKHGALVETFAFAGDDALRGEALLVVLAVNSRPCSQS